MEHDSVNRRVRRAAFVGAAAVALGGFGGGVATATPAQPAGSGDPVTHVVDTAGGAVNHTEDTAQNVATNTEGAGQNVASNAGATGQNVASNAGGDAAGILDQG